MSESQSRTSPIVVIASIAIIIFSAIGVGVMTGVIPNSFSRNDDMQAMNKAESVAPAPPATPHKTKPAAASARHQANEPARVASAPRVCANCGRVEAVNAIEEKGEGTGLGAVAGGVVGGILGNQVGGGTGRTIATVAGAGAGALAGNEVEKRMKKTSRYDVIVRLDDGSSRTFKFKTEPGFRAGDQVKIVDGAIVNN